jgi:hypothetical protein
MLLLEKKGQKFQATARLAYMGRGAQKAVVRKQAGRTRRRDDEWESLDRLVQEQRELSEAVRQLRTKYGDSSEIGHVDHLADRRVADASPIRISHAQKLLGVSNQTVRTWAKDGILDDFGGSPQRVGLQSVLRAKDIADELRAEGRSRDFMSVVLSRLEAKALEREPDFKKSVREMRRGKRLPRPY